MTAAIRYIFGLGVVCTLLSADPAAAVINASTANDVCPAAANPCTITQQIDVAAGSILDFGTRAVVLSGSGQLNAGSGVISVRCGSFTANTGTSAAINIKNNGFGGDVTIIARRSCSGDVSIPCLTDATCTGLAAGTCSAGTGEVLLGGKVTAQADSPGSLFVLAAGDLRLTQLINVSGTIPDSDGGEVDLESVMGSVTIDGKIQGTSGNLGEGGYVTLTAGDKIIINQSIDVTGGDFDGGSVDIFASGDVEIHEDILASSGGGEGFGGFIDVVAEGDLIISGGTSSNRLVLAANGNMSAELSGGDGGEHSYTADGSITVSEFVRFECNGAPPDGYGDTVDFDVGDTLTFAGDIEAKARGIDGAGGFVDFFSGAQMDILATTSIDLTGSAAGGGELAAISSAGLTFRGVLSNVASNGGIGGDIYLEAAETMSFFGSILTGGAGTATVGATVGIDACDILVKSGSSISNTENNAVNTLTGHGTIVVENGSSITASGAGVVNLFEYRDSTQPPAVSGVVSPTATQMVRPLLAPCPGCGNGIREKGETCDDGNLLGGDGCSSDCQDEGCIAGTPDYPAVPLCDDQSACTADACNVTTHACAHVTTCNDGIGCTVDTCVAGVCQFTPDDTRCDDTDECTDDFCAPGVGCAVTFNTAPCDDGILCTSADRCAAGTCAGVPSCPAGEVCSFATGMCELLTTTTMGTSTTTTTSTSTTTTTSTSTTTTTSTSTTTTTMTSTTTTTMTSTTTTTLPGAPVCGDGLLDSGESCDEGINNGTMGQSCNGSCELVQCGDPNDSGTISASDALFVLKAAVGASSCAPCVCDAVSSAGQAITASDALAVLRLSVGVVVPLSCPVCF